MEFLHGRPLSPEELDMMRQQGGSVERAGRRLSSDRVGRSNQCFRAAASL
jgi:hypothetical protein